MMLAAKLNKFFDDELCSDLKDVLITKDVFGKYTLFGKYTIIPVSDGQFKVRGKDASFIFSTIKNALAYVTLIHAGKYSEANRVRYLDLSLCSINLDLAIHRNILKNRTDDGERILYIIKIQEDTIKKRRIIDEIKTHINNSVRIQTRRFFNASTPVFQRTSINTISKRKS